MIGGTFIPKLIPCHGLGEDMEDIFIPRTIADDIEKSFG
jgi:hypothetical protein